MLRAERQLIFPLGGVNIIADDPSEAHARLGIIVLLAVGDDLLVENTNVLLSSSFL